MKRCGLLLVFSLSVSRLFCMDWPSPAGVTSMNFGWNDRGMPHLGVSFYGEGTLAAAENGELLFRRSEGDTASRLPSPLGSWAALDHGDGIISIYSRLGAGPGNDSADGIFRKSMVLGVSGISGWSESSGFYFQLFDRKERRWINPSLIITPAETMRPPVITQVTLRNAEGTIIDPSLTKNLNQGRYMVMVDASTRSPDNSPLAPYRIICSLNGTETGVLNFETYSARDGSLMVYRNGLVPVMQVFAPVPGYEIADVWFTRGQSTLEIIAQDIAGNVRNAVFRLMVE